MTELVCFFDVDDTLLDNDRLKADIQQYLAGVVGLEQAKRYWEIYEGLRLELGYADFLGALQRFRTERPENTHMLEVALFMLEYPFAERLFPKALDVIKHVQQWSKAVILSDGDMAFQPLKVARSGIRAAADGTLIYLHKQHRLGEVKELYPAEHYVMFDDKLGILHDMKQLWGARLTTVWVRQGHYAMDPAHTQYPPPDKALDNIADALALSREDLLAGA